MGTVDRAVYREARRRGYPAVSAAALARPARIELDSDPYVEAWDAGTFVFKGETFGYRVEWDDDCLCIERDSEVSHEDYVALEHRRVTVSFLRWDDTLGSVCGFRRDWFETRLDDHYLADMLCELATSVLVDVHRDQMRLWV